MGLFKKSKKDKKTVQDRFMRRALNAKFPDAKSSSMLEFEFTEAFAEKKLKVIGKVTDRAVIGRGEFDKPYQQAKEIARRYSKYISGDDVPNDTQVAEMITQFQKLETLAETWLAGDEAKWSNKDPVKKDRVTQIKEIEARGMLNGARTAIFQLNNRDRLQDDTTTKLVGHLEKARDKIRDPNTATRQDIEAYRSLDAAVLSGVCGSSKPSNGTSDVKLIKGPDGDVAYAFKSVEGESDMMGTPKGYATAREVMMSKLCDTLNDKYQIGLGWPKVSMATMGKQSGALIDGVKGMRIGGGVERDDVPGEALQRILLGNLAGGQFDIKWEDVRFERKGDTLQPICMDGGASMPDADTATTFLFGQSDGRPGGPLLHNGSADPNPDKHTCAGAKEKMDPTLVKQFLAIDTAELKRTLDAEAQALEQNHQLGVAKLGMDSGVQTSITSIEGIQAILRDSGGDLTLVQFMDAYYKRVVQKTFVEPNLKAWEKAQLAEFDKIRKTHPGLFETADKFDDIPDLYRGVLHPEMRAKLNDFAKLAQPGTIVDLMKTFDRPMPVKDFTGAFNHIKRARQTIADGLKGYDALMQKYPGLVKPKDSFASPLEAFLEVLDVAHTTALGSLKDLCERLSQSEGKTVTIAELLQRYGYSVPTSKFKEIYVRIQKAETAKQEQAQAQASQ